MASWRELQEEIREELEERKNVNRGLNPKRQALMTAIRKKNMEKVDRLLNQGVDPNFRVASGSFPLHVASSVCTETEDAVMEQIIERLVFMGADLEVQDRFGCRPLHIAAASSHRIVQILLDKGCSINAQDNAGCTALMAACRNNTIDPVQVVTLLIQRQANIHLTDDEGLTALHHICHNSDLPVPLRNKIALLLLHAGLSTSIPDCKGKMALCYELDKLMHMSYVMLPHVDLQLVETLICGGSNLQPKNKVHQHWLRLALHMACPKVLLTLLQLFSPVVTRASLRLIKKSMNDQTPMGRDGKDDGITLLQAEVHRLTHSVDSLQNMCRLSLRAHLRGKLLVYVPQLPVPNKLKNFLTSVNRTL